jgi:hypothetical protein
MPKYAARLGHDLDGSWLASALELPNCWSRGRTREEALGKLRDEIRYRIELCPCTGVADDFVEVVVRDQESRGPERTPAPPASLSGVAGCPSRPADTGERSREPEPPPRPSGWKRWD